MIGSELPGYIIDKYLFWLVHGICTSQRRDLSTTCMCLCSLLILILTDSNLCLSADDDTYEWLDVNFTPNDRYLMEKRKKQEGSYSGFQKPAFPPPLPPRLPQGQGFHKSLMSLDESALSSALSRPPLPARNKMFGSSDNLDLSSSSSSFNDRSGYGFLKTMPHSNSPKQIHSSYASTSNVSDSSEEEVDEIYDDSIFEEVTYPGQGGRGQIVSELISNDPNVVKASFSKPGRQNIHPGDRPPLPIPYEESRRSPLPIRMSSPPSTPPKMISLAPHSHPMPPPQRNTPRDGGMVPRSIKQETPSKMPPSPPVKHVSRVNSPPPFGSDGVSSELQQLLSKRQAGLHNTRVGEDVTKSSFTPPQPAGKKKAILPPSLKQPPKVRMYTSTIVIYTCILCVHSSYVHCVCTLKYVYILCVYLNIHTLCVP